MESNRWKNASLAINAIIRGLERDQIAFQYDEAAIQESAFGAVFAHGLRDDAERRLLLRED